MAEERNARAMLFAARRGCLFAAIAGGLSRGWMQGIGVRAAAHYLSAPWTALVSEKFIPDLCLQ
jgi:hypothetical protein